ncbi:MAG: TlpA disulfide reductase family protein [Pelodictyon phaeoclathratiforme]
MKKMVFSLKRRVFTLLFLGTLAATLIAPTPALALPLAPEFTAVSLDGKTVASTKLAGKAYIVNFFASWCPPCRAEIPDMVLLQKKYESKGFTFIGVAVNENEPSMRAFITKNGISYPVVMVEERLIKAFSRYIEGGIRAIPTSFVVNSSGRITQVITGGRSKEVFEKIIIDALKKPVTHK